MTEAVRRAPFLQVESRSTQLALTASLAAFYVVFRMVPTFPMFGVAGTFKLGDMVAPLYGILLGPVLGPVAVAIGTVIAFLTGAAPPIFLGLDFLPASTCAVMLGLVTRGRRWEAFFLNIALVGVFLALPFAPGPIRVGSGSFPYVWFYIVGIGLLGSPFAKWAGNIVLNDWRSVRAPVAMFGLVLIGTLAQHAMGGILTQSVIGSYSHKLPRGFFTWQDYWTFLFGVYPFERTVIAVIATLIAVPAILALNSSGLAKRLPGFPQR